VPSDDPDGTVDEGLTVLRDRLTDAAEGIARGDTDAENAAREVIGSGTDAGAKLGRLAEWGIWLSGIQGSYPIRPVDRVRLLLVGAELPPGHPTRDLLADTGAELTAVALQPDSSAAPDLAAAVETGIAAVDAAVDAGCDLLIITSLVDESICSTLTALLLRLSATEVVGDAEQLDDAAWAERVAGIRDRAHSARQFEDDPAGLLAALESPELAALVGMLLRAAARRTPVLLDGAPDCAAALCASRLAILGSWWWFAASGSGDAATGRAIDALGLEPLIDLHSQLDGGTAALTALPVLRAAQRVSESGRRRKAV
jgi:NaMN:DMB phosphoribosyltransferase